MFSKKIFGERLSEVRKKNQKTQADFAAFLDMSKSRISEMEAGKNTTTIENLASICEYYNVSSDYLLGLTDDMRPRTQIQWSSAAPEIEPAPQFTLEEFQEFADTHDGAWELIDGVPVKMDSGSDAHQWLCLNLSAQFLAFFRGKPCIPLPEKDMWASHEELNDARDKRKDATRKPDLLVYCSKTQRVHNVIVKPELVVEVWSPSNSFLERSAKQLLYQSLGVKELWLIDSVTRDFAIFSVEDPHLPKMQLGNIEEDELKSFIFPGLIVDLSGQIDYLENQ